MGKNLNCHVCFDFSMSERAFRLIQGIVLLLALYFELEEVIYAYTGILLFEGLTNYRIPILLSRLRYGTNAVNITPESLSYRFSFEAERMLRIIVFLFMLISYFIFPDVLWFFPWFIGVMLLMAGITNICPMTMVLRFIGFR